MDKRKTTRSKKSNFAGTTFASAFEAQVAEYLSAIGAEWQYEPVRLPWIPKLRLYVPDFFVRLPNGESFYLEAKGYFDPSARVKMSQIRKQYPDLDIRMFFMNEDVKIPPAKVTTYGDWADKNGFRYYTFDKDFLANGNNKERITDAGSFGIESLHGQGLEVPSGKASKSGTQSKRTTRRSTRTKDGSVQEETGATESKRRSTRRSADSTEADSGQRASRSKKKSIVG
jgi:hypothetical protein